MKAAIQNTKLKRYNFISSKENIQGTHHPLIRVGRKKKRGVMMKAAIQNTQKIDTSFNHQRKKPSRYTPPTNQGSEEKEEESNHESSHSKHKQKYTSSNHHRKKFQGTQHPLIRVGRKNKRGVLMKATIQNTK